MNSTFPQRITQARELAALSKTDLAAKLKVSVAAVTQWENGTKKPTTDNILAISFAIGVPMPFLLHEIPKEISLRGPITFRARSDVKTARFRKQAQRFAELSAEVFLWLENWVSFPATSLPEIEPGSDAATAAQQCRRAWGLGDLPIAKLGELLESKGVRLCAAELGDIRMDAYSCVMGGRAFAFLGTAKHDKARSRFDAAHELGHLVMHQHLSDEELEANNRNIENEAHAFASAFLLPAETFAKDITDASIDGFKRLKPKWGVSIQAMVHRARELDLISEATYSSHFRSIGARGWRQSQGEPLDDMIPAVNRSLGSKSLDLLESSNKIKPWEIASSLPLPDAVLISVFGRSVRDMVPKEIDNLIFLADHQATTP